MLQSAPILKIMCERNRTDHSNTEFRKSPPLVNESLKFSNEINGNGERTSSAATESFEEENAEGAAKDCNNSDDDKSDETDEEQKLVELMESRLQYILRSLIKLCSPSTKLVCSLFLYLRISSSYEYIKICNIVFLIQVILIVYSFFLLCL